MFLANWWELMYKMEKMVLYRKRFQDLVPEKNIENAKQSSILQIWI